MDTDNGIFGIISYVVVVILSIAFLYFGNRLVTVDTTIYYEEARFFEARVREVVTIIDHGDRRAITFEAEITRGERRGEVAGFTQNIHEQPTGRPPREARVGDRVVLALTAQGAWSFVDYVRIYNILILGAVFIILLTVFGRVKGFNSVLSLGFVCIAIFAVFIPSILSGRNIYMSSIIVCVYSIASTLFLINGVNKKSVAAVTGCLGGIIAAGVLILIMDLSLGLTGVTRSESLHLLYLTEYPIDLNAIIFAGIIIGATGAIMDMSMSISSAIWELKETRTTFSELYRSGINIGKDIVGSNINTLVLAYIGGSLTVVLIFLAGDISFVRLFNREWVIVELLQIIIGGFGIFFTMPLTALVCAALFSSYGGSGKNNASSDVYTDSWETIK